jgi:hypothetical protein
VRGRRRTGRTINAVIDVQPSCPALSRVHATVRRSRPVKVGQQDGPLCGRRQLPRGSALFFFVVRHACTLVQDGTTRLPTQLPCRRETSAGAAVSNGTMKVGACAQQDDCRAHVHSSCVQVRPSRFSGFRDRLRLPHQPLEQGVFIPSTIWYAPNHSNQWLVTKVSHRTMYSALLSTPRNTCAGTGYTPSQAHHHLYPQPCVQLPCHPHQSTRTCMFAALSTSLHLLLCCTSQLGYMYQPMKDPRSACPMPA